MGKMVNFALGIFLPLGKKEKGLGNAYEAS